MEGVTDKHNQWSDSGPIKNMFPKTKVFTKGCPRMPRVDEEQRRGIHPRSHCVPCTPWQGGPWQGGAWQGEWPSGCKEVLPPWPSADWRPQKLFCSSKWKSQPSSQVWKSNFCVTEIHYYFRWRKKSSSVPDSPCQFLFVGDTSNFNLSKCNVFRWRCG